MSPILQSYKIEYETTDITIPDLCEKYNITTKQLKGYTKWIKAVEPTNTIEIQPTEPAKVLTEPTTQEVPEQIDSIKIQILERTQTLLEDEYIEPLALKNLTDIVLKIEASTKDSPQQNNINILIQNLRGKYIDDC